MMFTEPLLDEPFHPTAGVGEITVPPMVRELPLIHQADFLRERDEDLVVAWRE